MELPASFFPPDSTYGAGVHFLAKPNHPLDGINVHLHLGLFLAEDLENVFHQSSAGMDRNLNNNIDESLPAGNCIQLPVVPTFPVPNLAVKN
jgi:hypothetical protein